MTPEEAIAQLKIRIELRKLEEQVYQSKKTLSENIEKLNQIFSCADEETEIE